MRQKLLVTGSGGLLGYALKQLCHEAIYVTSKDSDLTDICEVRRLFDEYKPDQVIHLAAKVGGVKKNADFNADLLSENIQINTNVLTTAREFGVSRLIAVISSCAFPVFPDRPSHEEDLHLGLPFKGNLGYGYSKRVLDIQTKLLWEQYGCRFSTITPVTMYGPHDNWDLENGHVIGALIHKSYLAKKNRTPLEVWGSGNAVRQFAYSNDVAKILLQSLDHFHGSETVIVAPDMGNTIKELATLIAEVMNFKGEIVFDPRKPEGQFKRVIKGRHFKKQFPDFSFTSLKNGLESTAQWFAEKTP